MHATYIDFAIYGGGRCCPLLIDFVYSTPFFILTSRQLKFKMNFLRRIVHDAAIDADDCDAGRACWWIVMIVMGGLAGGGAYLELLFGTPPL